MKDVLVTRKMIMQSRGKRLNALKMRLAEKRISINVEKSVEYTEEVSYLGFKISARGTEADDLLVGKIQKLETPISKKVDYFIGLANYFGCLIPNFAAKVLPLIKLRSRGNKFVWTAECFDALRRIKEEIGYST